MKKPVNSADLFRILWNKLKEERGVPEIIDYALADEIHSFPVDTYEVSLRNNLDYGGNEGIYLDLRLYLHGEEKPFATIKTLDESRDGMVAMGTILADFVIIFRKYVNDNIDDFTWDGYDVHAMKEDGTKEGWGYECATLDRALERKTELLKKYSRVLIRDNRTRKETIYKAPIKPFKTDDGQMLLKVDGEAYTFAEVREIWSEKTDNYAYALFSATIDLDAYTQEELSDKVRTYYPGGMEEVQKEYGKEANQIVAECLFEELSTSDVTRISVSFASEDDAINHLEEYAEEYYRKEVAS